MDPTSSTTAAEGNARKSLRSAVTLLLLIRFKGRPFTTMISSPLVRSAVFFFVSDLRINRSDLKLCIHDNISKIVRKKNKDIYIQMFYVRKIISCQKSYNTTKRKGGRQLFVLVAEIRVSGVCC